MSHIVAGAVLKKGDFGSYMLQNIFELERRSGIKLGLAQKTLLAETGTIEQVLSILTGSAVRVNIVEQREYEKTIFRESEILNDADRVLIRAHSKIFVCNLPQKIVLQIRKKELGIGTIIANSHLETFRKIIEVGYDPVNRLVFRKYQIIYRKKVAFEIREELVGV
jgi:chorismate-pyruvate lyase